MKIILVTGGAGFIGSHLCKTLLKANHNVLCLDNFNDFYDPAIKEGNIQSMLGLDGFTCIRGDIRDKDLVNSIFDRVPIDAVVNLAAMAGVRPSIENPLLYEDVNMKGFQVILETMKEHKVTRLIAASSSRFSGKAMWGISRLNTACPFWAGCPLIRR